MRRVAACLAALALAGCGGGKRRAEPAPSPTPRPPSAEELIQAALDRRARTSVARESRGLGVRRARYDVEGVRVEGSRARVEARLRYRVRGVDGAFGTTRTLRARRRGERWRITGTVDRRRAEPWEVDDYTHVRSPHFVVWVPEGLEAPLTALEDGYARMGDVLSSGRLEDRYLVVVARDPGRARAITESIRGLESLTALTDTDVTLTGRAERVDDVSSQRLVVVQPAFANLGFEAQRIVVAHELTHAALAPVTSGRTPSWLSEGLAQYVSDDDRRLEATVALREGELPTLGSLSAPDGIGQLRGDRQAAAYAVASAAAFFIAERYGRDALLDLYDAFNRERLRGARGDARLTDRAIRRTLGTRLRSLEDDLSAHLASR